MMKNKLLMVVSLMMMLATLMTACTASVATPEVTAVPTTDMPTIQPPTSTWTPVPTATHTPTLLPTKVATVTLTPTPMVDFTALKVSSMGYASDEIGWVMFVIPNIQPDYWVKIKNQVYTCKPTEIVANSLVCSGARIAYKEYVKIDFFAPGNDEPVYTTRLTLPDGISATATPVGAAQTWCPLRGTNVTCETEHRWEPDGTPCEVTSCFDACGYYYSIHTCSDEATFTIP